MSTLPIEPCEPRWLLTFFGVDHAFGQYGFASTDFGPAVSTNVEFVKALPGGKILAAGQGQQSPPGGSRTVAIARYDSSGQLDATFGTNGLVNTPAVDAILDAAVQSDGKILVVGGLARQFFVARYTAEGAVDPSFGTGGVVLLSFGTLRPKERALATAVAVQSDNKIVVAGQRTTLKDLHGTIAVARLSANGALDTTFDGDGQLITDFGNDTFVEDVAVTPAGKILVCGDQAQGTSGFLVRYNLDGTPDKTLAADGSLEFISISPTSETRNVTTVMSLQDEKMLVAVQSNIIRLTPDGSPDTTFGTDGSVVVPPAQEFGVPVVKDFTVDSSGNIVAVADSQQSGAAVVVARLTPDGIPDASFGPEGLSRVPEIRFGRSVAVSSDDTVYVGRAMGFSVGKVSARPTAELDELGILRIYGDENNDTISVTNAGNDVAVTRNGNTTSFAGSIKNVSVITGDGNDSINVQVPIQSQIRAGAGDDSILVPAGAQLIDAGDGNNTLTIGSGKTSVISGSGRDRITTGGGNKTIDSGGGNDRITTGNGDDTIDAGNGNNVVSSGSGNDNIDAGKGNDSIASGNGLDRIQPGDGNDTVTAGDGDDFISRSVGIKTIDAGPGNDQVGGDFFFLTAFGSGGTGTINGGTGDDLIAGGQAGLTVVINGGDGNDTLHAFGDATLFGDIGDDSLHGAGSSTVIRGGDGRDSIRGCDFADSLYGEAGTDTIFGSDGNDLISGGGGNDRILGQSGNDRIYGGTGNDRADGGPGKDRILGQDGDDLLNSQDNGLDTVDGGNGNDTGVIDLIDVVTAVEQS